MQTISEKIVQINEENIKGPIKELVRGSVEEKLNGLLDAEAEKLTQAAKYERGEDFPIAISVKFQYNESTVFFRLSAETNWRHLCAIFSCHIWDEDVIYLLDSKFFINS